MSRAPDGGPPGGGGTAPAGPPTDEGGPASALRRWLHPRKIGAVYLWLAIIVVLSVVEPDLFLTDSTARAIANNYAIAGMAALAVLIPLVAGTFDVSVGATMSLSSVVVGKLLLETDTPMAVAIAIGVLMGALVGLANGIVVVVLRIPSLIGTLAVSGIVGAIAVGVSGNRTLAGPRLFGDFSEDLAQADISGFTRPVVFVLVLMVLIGIVLEQTQVGRYLYAVGFNAQASHLAGLRVAALKIGALMAGGVLAAFTGVVLTARLASAAPSIGNPYLLPAFAAVFLGATQFRDLRFNAWGTAVAVFMLGTGQYGLLLVGAPSWTADVFQGIALIGAVGLTHFGSRRGGVAGDGAGMA